MRNGSPKNFKGDIASSSLSESVKTSSESGPFGVIRIRFYAFAIGSIFVLINEMLMRFYNFG